MVNQFTKDHIVSERSKKSVLGTHLSTFMSVVADLGYSPSTIQTQMKLLKSLIRWVQENDVVISNIDESITDRFLSESGRKGTVRRGDNKTLHRFLDHLRREGTIPHPKPTFDDSPMAHLKSQYDDYLLKERGLSTAAGSRYWPYIQRFLLERYGHRRMRLYDLCPQDIDNK